MNDVKVEVVDAPVCQLLLADWLDFVAVVEAVPQFRDEKELFPFDDAFFDCFGYTLA